MNDTNTRIEETKELPRILDMDGDWNYAPHMFGMEFILSTKENRPIEYPNSPQGWIKSGDRIECGI
jgi:hypothetical protein